MKKNLFLTTLCAATLLTPLALSAGCSHEVSHSESNQPGWFGGRTKSETTVYQSSNGTTSTEHSTQTTR